MRSTAMPSGASASSIATSEGWSRPAPAPGVSRRAARGRALRAGKEDALGLGQLGDATACAVGLGAVVGMGLADEGSEAAEDLAAGGLEADGEAEHAQRPSLVAEVEAATEGGLVRREVLQQAVVGAALPAGGASHESERLRPHRVREPGGGVQRGECLGQHGAVVVELQPKRLAVAHEAMAAAVQPVHVGLEAVPHAGLDDATATRQVVEEAVDVVALVVVEPRGARADDGGEQHRPVVVGEEEVAERDATRRRDRTGVPDLQLGEQHVPHGTYTKRRRRSRSRLASAMISTSSTSLCSASEMAAERRRTSAQSGSSMPNGRGMASAASTAVMTSPASSASAVVALARRSMATKRSDSTM